MKKVLSFSAMLMLGLVLSQLLPGALGANYEHTREVIEIMLGVCLAFIMINVGREFEVAQNIFCLYQNFLWLLQCHACTFLLKYYI